MPNTYYPQEMPNGLWPVIRCGNSGHPSLWADTEAQAREWAELFNANLRSIDELGWLQTGQSIEIAVSTVVGLMIGNPVIVANGGDMKSYKEVWPNGIWRTARKDHFCDWNKCSVIIRKGDRYFDPGESNLDRAGGFGGYRFCKKHD